MELASQPENNFLPSNVRFVAENLENYASNRFRLETLSSDTGKAGRVISVNLMEGSLIDLSSFALHMDLKTTSVGSVAGAGGDLVYGKLPADAAHAVLQRVEVFCNGQAINGQGLNEYNTAYALKKLQRGAADRTGSVDRCLTHGEISSADDSIDDVSVVVSDWIGLLGDDERSCRYIPSDVYGMLSVRITLAPNAVLAVKQDGVAMTAAKPLATAAAVANARLIEYDVSNIYFTCDTASLPPAYNEYIRELLTMDGNIQLNTKDYYSFSLDNITSGASTTRYSLSTGSLDKIMGTFRDSNFQNVGIPSQSLENAGLGQPAFQSNYFRFRSYNNSVQKAGSLLYNFTYNNIQRPQFRANVMNALRDVNFTPNKLGLCGKGTNVCSKESFNDGKFCLSAVLNHPTNDANETRLMSGQNSRGISSMMTMYVSGQTIPAADTNPDDPAAGNGQQNTGVIGSYVLVECTSAVRAGLGKDIVFLP
jgi:hypothetical protein